MEQNYSIEEILSAVKEIQNKKKLRKKSLKISLLKKTTQLYLKNTLKLIEEAEKLKIKLDPAILNCSITHSIRKTPLIIIPRKYSTKLSFNYLSLS